MIIIIFKRIHYRFLWQIFTHVTKKIIRKIVTLCQDKFTVILQYLPFPAFICQNTPKSSLIQCPLQPHRCILVAFIFSVNRTLFLERSGLPDPLMCLGKIVRFQK